MDLQFYITAFVTLFVIIDPLALTREDTRAEGEARFVSIGRDHVGQVVVVVFAEQGEDLRLISARRASRGERRQYEEGIRL